MTTCGRLLILLQQYGAGEQATATATAQPQRWTWMVVMVVLSRGMRTMTVSRAGGGDRGVTAATASTANQNRRSWRQLWPRYGCGVKTKSVRTTAGRMNVSVLIQSMAID